MDITIHCKSVEVYSNFDGTVRVEIREVDRSKFDYVRIEDAEDLDGHTEIESKQ